MELTSTVQSVFKRSTLDFYLNGTKIELREPNPQWTLLDFIRSQHGLKGTKLGCGEGGCGACTVVLQTLDRGRIKHLAVNACLFPLIGVIGKHVITVEGLGDIDNPHPLQERMAKLHGSQCGFCTPGIVMSLYALIRNSYDPVTKKFHLSENDIEMEGHLDGNLCRCTGYKPILQAAKTFIIQDLKGQIAIPEGISVEMEPKEDCSEYQYRSESSLDTPLRSQGSCGRPGGCCRDPPKAKEKDSSSDESSKLSDSSSEVESTSESSNPEENETPVDGASYGKPMKSRETDPTNGEAVVGTKTTSNLDAGAPKSKEGYPQITFIPYSPDTELIFPPGLKKYQHQALMFGNDTHIWLRPINMEQLLLIKDAYPEAKMVGGASEVQVEVRFKNSHFPISIYVNDVEELRGLENKYDVIENLDSIEEVILGANASLTEVEGICKDLSIKLGKRGSVLEAARKQLRYFAGRQIRNVASLAGNIATASPISDMNPVLMASGATLTAESKSKGKITLPLSTFFVAYRKTTLPVDAVITHIHIPLPPPGAREITKAYKQAKRKDDDIAIVTAAFRVRLDDSGLVSDISLAYGGMAPTTLEAKTTMSALIGKKWRSSATLNETMSSLAQEFNLKFSVPGGMATYRRTLAMSLFFRFWHETIADFGVGKVDPSLVSEIHRSISTGYRDNYNPHEQRVVGKQIPHLSSLKQNTGEAQYIDDMPKQDRELYGAMVLSSRAHAKLVEVDFSPAIGPGLAVGYVDKHDVRPDQNLWGSVVKDEPFFADGEVFSHGQPIGMVYAETQLQAQAAARAVKIVYEDLPTILTIDEAIEAKSFFKHGKILKKGIALEDNMDDVWSECDRVFEGTTRMGGQEHFYLETNSAMVIPNKEEKSYEVCMETQEFVAQVTGVPSHKVNARVKRMGGAFGGKESRSVQLACLLAVAAKKSWRPVRCMLNRDEDMMTSGQRHPVQARWKVGVKHDGTLIALEADVYDNAGFSQDMSGAVMDRCCTHLENCYEIPHVLIRGHVCKTNTHSNTAFRGFGGPQAMFIAESYMCAVAEGLDIPVDELRWKNLYKQGQLTPFLQRIDEDWHVPMLLEQVRKEVDYDTRCATIEKFNSENKWKKRGICMIPTKFGLSFATALHLNQAGASVKIYADGSILLHHGGTEMGQGLYTKMCQVCAQELNVPLDSIFTQDTTTYQIANASPTAASSGSDLNGMAVKDACDQLNERLKPFREKYGKDAPMKTLAHAAYLERVNLAANGFWKMPKIGYVWGNYDLKTVKPMYYYFTQGVAVSEVELDVLTGDHTVLRTDIKMDIGRSINPAIDYGQIEGAFVQGQGLYTMEETLWTQKGELFTKGPGTYKIPGFSDIPQEFNVSFLQGVSWNHLRSIQSSKGIGEPPLFLGATVLFALREAVKSARKDNGVEEPLVLDSPATAERLRLAVGDEILKAGEVVPEEGEKSFFVAVA
ncbi:probable xanthine dehydrogenase [Phialocephala subalpina]|uniref:xanthine dehydrogenase n=1 Tax=Phialocephala subalpina TaxID=576137 RepID=A0A1L7XRN8_9HELO|nr:probable xanthine dehydrogenase [Phialocephala subalpina]